MRIGVDVMGGDHAPDAILEGALAAAGHLSDDDALVLVGDERVIRPAVDQHQYKKRIEVVATTEVIGMDESPVEAVRNKPDSSMTVLARLCSAKHCDNPLDAIISAGNTGAQVTAAQMYMRRLPHVTRPGIAVIVPTFSGKVVLIDVGANIEPKPQHLAQYGVMGSVYAELAGGVKNPRVGLMNIGGEEQKGTSDMKEARNLLRDLAGVNFVGFIEGRDVFSGGADVIITDGVVGNVVIKLAEGLADGLFRSIAREIAASDPQLAERFKPVVKKIYAQHDYHEYGGAPLLGANGVCIISHGSSQARTITNAVLRAREFIQSGVNDAMCERLAEMAAREAVA